MTTPRKRNKNGLAYRSPIALRLMPDEREQAVQLSRRCGKTMSAFARDAYLAGIPLIMNSKKAGTPSLSTPALSSGESLVSGFYSSPAASANNAADSGGTPCINCASSFYSESTGAV